MGDLGGVGATSGDAVSARVGESGPTRQAPVSAKATTGEKGIRVNSNTHSGVVSQRLDITECFVNETRGTRKVTVRLKFTLRPRKALPNRTQVMLATQHEVLKVLYDGEYDPEAPIHRQAEWSGELLVQAPELYIVHSDTSSAEGARFEYQKAVRASRLDGDTLARLRDVVGPVWRFRIATFVEH